MAKVRERFMWFSALHYLRMKAIQNQRNAILSLLSLPKMKRRYWIIITTNFISKLLGINEEVML